MSAPFDSGMTLADRMRRHAAGRDHLYAQLMRAMADDWEQGGPVRIICRGWEDAPPGSVVQLRLLGGLFRIVLTGRAPELVPFYACLGGSSDPSGAWPAVRSVLASNIEELHESLTVAPQTNEVGRANALLVGIFAAVARTGLSKVRLLEPGASAGLNLLVDRFRFINDAWAFGPLESPVVLAGGVLGEIAPVDFEIAERRGCDLSPVDATTEEGRLRLRSFVWPFHVHRHERLSAALDVAEALPPVVDRATAGEWLGRSLAQPPPADVVTVVWQSITRLYWPPAETAEVDRVVRECGATMPIAHVCMEYASLGNEVLPELTLDWSTGSAGPRLRHEKLGSVDDHGFPVVVGT